MEPAFCFSFMREARPECQITGVDLSAEQLATTQRRYADVTLWQGDIAAYQPEGGALFDSIWCNACFGNFYQPKEALTHMATLLRHGGRVLVTHPLGAGFCANPA